MKDSLDFGWATKPLGDLVEVLDRLRKPITKKNRKAGPYPYYGATGVLDHVDGYIFDEPLVLIGEDGAKWDAGANSAFAIDGKTWVNNHAHVMRPLRDKILDDWLIYYLNGADLMPFISGMTVPKLNQGRLREIPIPVPPLEEQRRIVAVLDEAFDGLDRAKENAEVNLRNSRELFESIKSAELAYSDFDREEVILSEVADITSSLVDPREKEYTDMLNLGAGNMITGTDELIDVKTAREEKLKSGKYLFDETTVLYSKIRPYLRKAARPNFHGLCSADVYPLTPRPGRLDRDFLFHLLLGNDFTEYAISGSDRAGMPKVNRKHMFSYRFELPPLEAQKRIANAIDEAHVSCNALVELANKTLHDLGDLRQSVLQKAFTGELS